LRDVDDAAGDIHPIRQDQAGSGIARRDAPVAAVFGQIEDVTVGKPGKLSRKLISFARGRRDRHGKSIRDQTGDGSFEPTEVIDVGNDAFARLADDRRKQGNAAWRHVQDLARELTAIRQHVAPKQIDADTLKSAALLLVRQDYRLFDCESHEVARAASCC
jgi:hypothetical protein